MKGAMCVRVREMLGLDEVLETMAMDPSRLERSLCTRDARESACAWIESVRLFSLL